MQPGAGIHAAMTAPGASHDVSRTPAAAGGRGILQDLLPVPESLDGERANDGSGT